MQWEIGRQIQIKAFGTAVSFNYSKFGGPGAADSLLEGRSRFCGGQVSLPDAGKRMKKCRIWLIGRGDLRPFLCLAEILGF